MTMKEIAKKIIASINPGKTDIGGIGDGTLTGAIDELNNNFGGLRLGVDGDGNGGYYKADDSFIPFKKCPSVFEFVRGFNSQTSITYTADKEGIYIAAQEYDWNNGNFSINADNTATLLGYHLNQYSTADACYVVTFYAKVGEVLSFTWDTRSANAQSLCRLTYE